MDFDDFLRLLFSGLLAMLILTMIAVFVKELTRGTANIKESCFADPNYSSDCQNIFLLALVKKGEI